MAGGYVVIEAIFLISAIVAASAFSTTIYSMINDIGQIQRENLAKVKNEITTEFRIIFAYGVAGGNTVKLWVKNVGGDSLPDSLIRLSDIYLKTPSNVLRIPYGGWVYSIVNDENSDGRWGLGETLEITVTLDAPLETGDYTVKFVAYNGFTSSYFFSV